MTLIGATDYEGGQLNNNNPVLMGYNGTHFESLETMSPEDDIRAIELVNLVKSNNYLLNKTHIQSMARISHNKPVATKETADKAKVNPGEYRDLKHRFKCQVCNSSYKSKIDLTQHNALVHARRHCIICKAQKYGDNNLNDHTKKCREIRDKKGTKMTKNTKKYKKQKQDTQMYIYASNGRRTKKRRKSKRSNDS